MAPRRKGAFELNEVVETPKTMPLDARQLVRSKEEMLDTDSFPNGYKGLFTAERTEGKLWMLMDHQNPTLEESWKVIGPYDDTDLQTRVAALEEGGGGGVAQVQSDWNETDTTSKAFIQNKPIIPPAYDDTALASRVTALEEAEIPPPSWDEVTDKPANLATTDDVNAKILVAEYNVTTAQEIMDYMDASNEPYAPIVIKRDTNYHTVNTVFKRDDETVILRSTGTINGEYYMFTYAITGNTWAISTDYGFQRKLESGTNIKTVGGQSLLGSGDIPVSGSQVQADWNEADTASAAYIQNKPSIPEAYDDTAIQAALAGKADASSLANVATSGSYNDLGDKPTIPEAYDDGALAARIAAVETTLPNKANTADLANVATSGSYNDLGDKPTIPEAYDDSGLRSRVSALEAKTETQADWNETDTDSAAYIANKPTIPAAYDDTALAGRVTAVETALPGKADSSSLATVATSGSYNDLTDKPTIPEAYDDTALAARVSANETALADRYTKAETDGKIAEAIDDVNVEHFHTVTALPPVTDALENHEYVLVTYEQDGVTIATEEHYLFYDGVFHSRPTSISLDGYATEQYVDNAIPTIDSAMSDTSENPVQNKVVLAAIGDAVDVVDTTVQGLDSRVTAVEDGKASLQVAAIPGGGGGEEINALVSQGENSVSVSYYKDGALPNTLNLNVDSDYFTIPATGYVDQKAAETQNNAQVYTDLKLTQKQNTLISGTNIKTFNGESLLGSGDIPIPAYVGSGWGVAKVGSVNFNATTTPTTVDISDLRLSSVDDYQVAVSISGSEASSNYKIVVVKTNKDSFTITPSAHVFTANYTVFAKGYGGVPNGGTTGQVLAKKSNADGDTEWVPGGGGINIEVGKERWQGTYTDENGETFQVYSKMVYIPALPATAGITTYDHGVANIKQILNIYGFTADGFVLNAPRQNVQDNITIYQASKSATNQTFSIEVGKDRSNKTAYVVMVYAKNN